MLFYVLLFLSVSIYFLSILLFLWCYSFSHMFSIIFFYFSYFCLIFQSIIINSFIFYSFMLFSCVEYSHSSYCIVSYSLLYDYILFNHIIEYILQYNIYSLFITFLRLRIFDPSLNIIF